MNIINKMDVWGHRLALAILLLVTVITVTYPILAALGMLEWVKIPIIYGGTEYDIGAHVSIALALVFIALCAIVPSSARVLKLEVSHRDFRITMDDVKESFKQVFEEDRRGIFTLPGEFDGVRERMDTLLADPTLGDHDRNILVLAAQMGQASKELAEAFSEENVQRARESLEHRLQDIKQAEELIEKADTVSQELQGKLQSIQMQEGAQQEVAQQLIDELETILATRKAPTTHQSNIAQMRAPAE